MSDAMIGLVGGLVGVVIGFVLEVVRSWWSDRHKAEEQAKAVRTIIQCELNHNITALKGYRRMAQHFNEMNVEKAVLRKQEFINIPFSHRVWDSQLHLVGTILTSLELQKVSIFYNRLNYLDNLRLKITRENLQPSSYKTCVESMLELSQQFIEEDCPLLIKTPMTHQ